MHIYVVVVNNKIQMRKARRKRIESEIHAYIHIYTLCPK